MEVSRCQRGLVSLLYYLSVSLFLVTMLVCLYFGNDACFFCFFFYALSVYCIGVDKSGMLQIKSSGWAGTTFLCHIFRQPCWKHLQCLLLQHAVVCPSVTYVQPAKATGWNGIQFLEGSVLRSLQFCRVTRNTVLDTCLSTFIKGFKRRVKICFATRVLQWCCLVCDDFCLCCL